MDGEPIPSKNIKKVNGDVVTFLAPPGPQKGGDVIFQVASSDRKSNPLNFSYLPGAEALPPVKFKQTPMVEIGDNVAAITYCFGKVYVSSAYDGFIYEYTLNEDYSLKKERTLSVVASETELGMKSILGMVCDPWGSDESYKIYFSLSHLFYLEN